MSQGPSDTPGGEPDNRSEHRPRPVPPPAPPSQGPTAGQILLGLFLILFGLCVTLLGGGCTVMWIAMAGESSGPSGGIYALVNPLFLISLVVLAGGLITVWTGVKFLMGRYRT
jgi:hypothetical protein